MLDQQVEAGPRTSWNGSICPPGAVVLGSAIRQHAPVVRFVGGDLASNLGFCSTYAEGFLLQACAVDSRIGDRSVLLPAWAKLARGEFPVGSSLRAGVFEGVLH